MDFYACPLRDEREKRVWDLLVCDGTGSFQESRFCSNQEVNSDWVASQLEQMLETAPMRPAAIRVFRSRMSSIMQRGCEAAGIPMRPSRRTYRLQRWIKDRRQRVYPQSETYAYNPADVLEDPLFLTDPSPLPDKLLGDRWAFVTLQAKDLRQARGWPMQFGDVAFDPGWDQMGADTIIPGLLIGSQRAVALSAWMSGVEPGFLRYMKGSRLGLALEAGQTDSYWMAQFRDDKTQAEAEGFEARKQQAEGIHFLGIQEQLGSESFAGFWLLQEWSYQ
jgi:hypothetical protein